MEYVHSFMDRVLGNAVHWLTGLIKWEPSKSQWRAQIHQAKGNACFLISAVMGRMDGGDPTGHWERRCRGTVMAVAIAVPHELAGAPLRASPGCGG
jgi:hypothetical protein